MERCESCVRVRGLSHCEFDVSMCGVECMTQQSTERLVTVTRESGEVRRARVSLESVLESTLDRGCVLLCPKFCSAFSVFARGLWVLLFQLLCVQILRNLWVLWVKKTYTHAP